MMDSVERYLSLPTDERAWLRWSPAGDAVLNTDTTTFALSAQISLFIEGFSGLVRDGAPAGVPWRVRLLEFGQLLHVLGFFCQPSPHEPLQRLRRAYLKNGYSLGNAGALAAHLTRDIPRAPEAVDVAQVCGTLWSPLLMAELTRRWREGTTASISPVDESGRFSGFFSHFFHHLAELSDADLDHWLKHGCSPPGKEVERLAEPLPERRATLGEIFAELEARPRLASAVPLVTQMVSALTLPPRRVQRAELPVGGYADVSNRGQPEQLLPSQFAIDDDLEFIRRFAENELLYFRREEPSVQIREELIVLIDQGVRTWGIVRLALTAAVFALARRAEKRKLPFRLAGTSSVGKLVAPLDIDRDELGKLLEASDLSFEPGLALETVLDERATRPRDVVLLTQPRNLDEQDVQTAARKVVGDTRLFALAVDEEGAARLAEFRRGTPIALRQFRVDLTLPETAPPPATDVPAADAWTGDVEPVGFPFRFGLSGKLCHLDFTLDESWLLAAMGNGMLYAASSESGQLEVLPRPMHAGKLFTRIQAVLGVAGGFAVAGQFDALLVVAHYDLHTRRVRVHLLDSLTGEKANRSWRWFYFADHHVVVADCHDMTRAVDLATNQHAFQVPGLNVQQPPGEQVTRTDAWGSARLRAACERASSFALAPPWLLVAEERGHYRPPYVRLDKTGTITVAEEAPGGSSTSLFTPLADGCPALSKARIVRACLRGGVVAIHNDSRVEGRGTGHVEGLKLYGIRNGTPLADLPEPGPFMLSPQGRYLAYEKKNDVILRRICMEKEASLLRGRYHNEVEAELGKNLLIVRIRNRQHWLTWHTGTLMHQRNGAEEARVSARAGGLPEWASYDRKRFLTHVVFGALTAVVDCFGQVTITNRGNVVCMFFVFRDKLAAWLPDGTRYGPADITGGPATVGALEKIGHALQAAAREAR